MSITVAPSAKSVADEKHQNGKKSARRSSLATDLTQDTDLETFDYDTSDSIEEEDDDEEEVVEKLERNSKKSSRNSILYDEIGNVDLSPTAVATAPGRKSRGSIGSRQSSMRNMSTGSSLGGTLPLADSDDENDVRKGSDRLSLDSLYDKRCVSALRNLQFSLPEFFHLHKIPFYYLSSNLHNFRSFSEAFDPLILYITDYYYSDAYCCRLLH